MQGKNILSVVTFVGLMMLLGVASNFAFAQTNVIGFISQNTTWTQANSPYVALGKIVVKKGVTLTIEPGVTVQLGEGHSLTIEGALIAKGAADKGIKFTSKDETSWGGILFEKTSVGAKFDKDGNYISGSILEYCTVERAGIEASSVLSFINHCDISQSDGIGISISNVGTVIIRNSKVADNAKGGIYIKGCSIAILIGNTLIKNTRTYQRGALSGYGSRGRYEGKGSGIFIEDGYKNVELNNNTLIENSSQAGGGIYLGKGKNVEINNNTFVRNTATGKVGRAGGGGGGIYALADIININNNTFTENDSTWAYDAGGGICAKGKKITIKGNTLMGNKADKKGGGMYVSGDTVIINSNILTRNEAGNKGGGAIYVSSKNFSVDNNTLIGNSTGGYFSGGGAIYVNSGVGGTISNNIIIANVAFGEFSSGGGILFDGDTTVTVRNNIITANKATTAGGGLRISERSRCRLKIIDNVITENNILGSDGAAIMYFQEGSIIGNIIANNVARGEKNRNAIYICKSDIGFTGNSITNNKAKYTVYYNGRDNLDAKNNYWGITTETELRATFRDYFADGRGGIVEPVPFLTANPIPLGSLTVAVNPKALSADGASTAVVTATLKGPDGKPIVDEKLTMVVGEGTGNLSEVKNNGDGTYQTTYTAGDTVGTAKLWVVAPKSRLAKSAEVTLLEPVKYEQRTLSIPQVEVATSKNVIVTVNLDDVTDIAKADVQLSYDSNLLSVQDIASTNVVGGLTFAKKTDVAGKMGLSLTGQKGLTGGSGQIFQITLKIAKDASIGETQLKFDSVALYDEFGRVIPSSCANGKIQIKRNMDIWIIAIAAGAVILLVVGLIILSKTRTGQKGS